MQDKITAKEIEDAVAKAFNTAGAVLDIRGYISGTGSVTDYQVSYIGKSGYRRLVTESIKALDSVWNPGDYDEATWEKAKKELLNSWLKTLNDEHTPKAITDKTVDPEQTSIMHLRAESIFQRKAPDKEVNSAALTLAKNDITLQVPLGVYVGRLNLTPSKIKSIKVVLP